MFEVVLKEYCKFEPELGLLGDKMIDTACLDIPKVPAQTVCTRLCCWRSPFRLQTPAPPPPAPGRCAVDRYLWCPRWQVRRPLPPSCCATTSTQQRGQLPPPTWAPAREGPRTFRFGSRCAPHRLLPTTSTTSTVVMTGVPQECICHAGCVQASVASLDPSGSRHILHSGLHLQGST
jgi:hypothetical protein